MSDCDWGRLTHYLNAKLERAFKRYGLLVGRHPYCAIALGLLITVIFGAGAFRLEFNNDFELFMPHSTRGWKDKEIISAQFGDTITADSDLTSFIGEADNVLQTQILIDLLNIDTQLRNSTFFGLMFSNVCQPVAVESSDCIYNNLLATLGLQTEADIINAAPTLLADVAALPSSTLENIVGGLIYDSNSQLVGAKALLFNYIENQDPSLRSNKKKWEEGAFYQLEDQAARVQSSGGSIGSGYTIRYFNYWGTDQESVKLVIQEAPLMGGTIVIVLVYMCFILGQKPMLRSRFLLGTTCIVTVLASLGSALGLCIYFGLTMTLLSPLVVFVLLGVGVDDMIIIVDAFESTESHPAKFSSDDDTDHITRRLSLSLGVSGYAITITSFTSGVAFFFASFVDFPAISYFCQLGGTAIFFVYVIQLTFFLGCLVLDQRRVESGRYDLLPCFHVPIGYDGYHPSYQLTDEDPSSPAVRAARAAHADSDADTRNTETGCCSALSSWSARMGGCTKGLMRNYLAYYLARPIVSAVVVLAFLIFTMISIYMLLNISTNTDNLNFYEENSFVRTYFTTLGTYFSDMKSECMIYTDGTDIQYEQLDTQDAMTNLINQYLALPFVFEPVDSWLVDLYKYGSYANTTIEPSTFYATLATFLVQPPFNFSNPDGSVETIYPGNYLSSVKLSEDNSSIVASIISFQVAWPTSVNAQIDQTKELRALLPDRVFPPYPPPGSPDPFAGRRGTGIVWTIGFQSSDRDEIMVRMIIQNLLLAAVGVTGVLFMLIHPGLVLLLIFSIVTIDVDLMGLMSAWGVPLDISAFICLAMAIGLSVDYVVHVGHSYMRQLHIYRQREMFQATEDDFDIDSDREAEVIRNGSGYNSGDVAVGRLPKSKQKGEKDPAAAQYADDSPLVATTTTVDVTYAVLKGAFDEIGTSVLNGGLSTFLGISLLALARSPGFRTFFRILFGTVAFGLLHGLLFAPAVLTLFTALDEYRRRAKRASY